jgi:hypothetical protein
MNPQQKELKVLLLDTFQKEGWTIGECKHPYISAMEIFFRATQPHPGPGPAVFERSSNGPEKLVYGTNLHSHEEMNGEEWEKTSRTHVLYMASETKRNCESKGITSKMVEIMTDAETSWEKVYYSVWIRILVPSEAAVTTPSEGAVVGTN